ncbi:alcohol dehydrogenase [Aspergillus nanangensis]|uniref:Alcohol dehydrogenase n=1 Tax=Aspergillus nanangensis TaxID=2582783 RepID=A0AAD4CE06_ASPNN|nr:alcohol dehydrogenase [Aspergillus nanangensis]
MATRNTAAVLTGPYKEPYTIREQLAGDPGLNEALIQIEFAGICHGDVYSRDGGGPAPATPVRPIVGGHEGIGKIMKLGVRTGNSNFSVGDTVGIAWRAATCHACDACLAAAENRCRKQEVTGLHRNGTFQTYVTFPVDNLIPIPSNVDRTAACPILCAGVTSYTALAAMAPSPGKWCVIVGAAGGLGHLAIQFAKNCFGLKVLAIDGGNPAKERFCREMGCDEYVDFNLAGSSLAQRVCELTHGGADYVLVLAPSQAAYNAAGDYARFRAQIMAVGVGACSMPLRPLLQKDLTVRASETGTREDILKALNCLAEGKVSPCVEMVDFHSLDRAIDRVTQGDVQGRLVMEMAT